MIGGARSAKSPRDQAYIYFACFEGRAAGGCRERRRGRRREREGTVRSGRTGGAKGPQQCGIWRVLVPSNSTRCSSAAGCIISRSLARSRAHRATGLLFRSPPSLRPGRSTLRPSGLPSFARFLLRFRGARAFALESALGSMNFQIATCVAAKLHNEPPVSSDTSRRIPRGEKFTGIRTLRASTLLLLFLPCRRRYIKISLSLSLSSAHVRPSPLPRPTHA